MDTYVKRIQSRLKSRYKVSVSLTDIRKVYPSMIKIDALPDDEELWGVVEYFNPESHQNDESALAVEKVGSIVEIPTPEVSEDLVEEIPQPKIVEIPVTNSPCLNPPEETATLRESTVGKIDTVNESLNELVKSENNMMCSSNTENIASVSFPQAEVKDLVVQAFTSQPQEVKDQITEYALQHSFENVRQVQDFLEQLRGMEFNLLTKTLQDHFYRRGSMLTVLNEVIQNQQQKDQESQNSFFGNFQTRLTSFQQ